MKNLFSYANHELSQDAFLRWLFENFDDETVGEAAKDLIVKLLSKSGFDIDQKDIISVKTEAQWKYIDVVAEIETSKGSFLLAIEDKVSSEEHHQLSEYNKVLDWRSKEGSGQKKFSKIFYKPIIMDGDEKQRVIDSEWTLFQINDIANFFDNYVSSKSEILSQYSCHVKELKTMQEKVSSSPMAQWNLVERRAYIVLELWPAIQKEFGEGFTIWINEYQGKYVQCSFCIYKGKSIGGITIYFRNGDNVTANIYVGVKSSKNGKSFDDWGKDVITQNIRSLVDEKWAKRPPSYFSHKDYKKCIGNLTTKIKKDDHQEVTKKLLLVVRDFYDFFESIDLSSAG